MSAWGAARLSPRLPRFAEVAVERARLTVVPRYRPPVRRVPFFFLVALLLLGGVVGLLLFNTHMQQASFRASALEARADRMHAREQQLRLDLDRLRDPQQVALRAKGLGMVPIGTPAFIRLGDGRVLGAPMAATSVNGMRLTELPMAKPAVLRPAPIVVTAPADPKPVGKTKPVGSGGAGGDVTSAAGPTGASGAGDGAGPGTKNKQRESARD